MKKIYIKTIYRSIFKMFKLKKNRKYLKAFKKSLYKIKSLKKKSNNAF